MRLSLNVFIVLFDLPARLGVPLMDVPKSLVSQGHPGSSDPERQRRGKANQLSLLGNSMSHGLRILTLHMVGV